MVNKDCQKREACQVDVSREFFGYEECPQTEDALMSLWLVYSCDGGGTDRTKSKNPKCDNDEVIKKLTTATTTTELATTTTELATTTEEKPCQPGKMVKSAIPFVKN